MVRPTSGEGEELASLRGVVDIAMEPPLGEWEVHEGKDGIVLVGVVRVPAGRQ